MTPLRTAAHVHSDWSYDGQWSHTAIARAFRRQRYEAVLMTEHDRGFDQARWEEYQRRCAAVSADGVRWSRDRYEDPDNVVHITVWGEEIPFLGSAQPTLDLLEAAGGQGAITVFAHPWRRDANLRYQGSWRSLLSAMEIWNRKYDGVAPGPMPSRSQLEKGWRRSCRWTFTPLASSSRSRPRFRSTAPITGCGDRGASRRRL